MTITTGVIGTGTWGTALAGLLAAKGAARTVLWGRAEDDPELIERSRRHPNLEGHVLPDGVRVTGDVEELAGADLLFWVVPTPFSADMARRLSPRLPPGAPVVSCAKGIEQETLRTVSTILRDELGADRAYGCLSGPTHAEEVAAGRPTGASIAGPPELTARVVERLHGRRFRLYTATDLLGVELCGALKNVIAVAAGIATGLDLGDNAKATLITRGLAEMRRLGRTLGASDITFAGLAGIGDLLTTCYSPHGRNRALGLAAAIGKTAEDYMASSGMIAEGAWTCRSAVALGAREGVELPIAEQVEAVLWRGRPVQRAIEELLARTAKEEAD